MIIKKRYVYIDAPLKIEVEKHFGKTEDENIVSSKERELMEVVAKANREAEAIVLEAKRQADEILQRAQEEYNLILNQANEQAKQILEGALREKDAMLNEFNQRLSKVLEDFDKTLDDILQAYSTKLLRMVRALVAKFLEKEVDPELTKRKLDKVLVHLVSATKVKIRINPEDMKILPPELLQEIRMKGFEIVSDPTIKNGVIAETDIGTIDTTLDFQMTMLDEIFEEFAGNQSLGGDIGAQNQ
ncbi:FliH/SctL family protein [Fervidobacterium thailandense]|uniref:Flagellar biosynthesis protein n=1 Tax=Fervidobacterium thailandense TaxID=1008305 RepID=A0A1E3G2B2_9BACT|nr:FliH/SctL family protein [Fervidobacterium thailandense]ODN30302.1 flagellar biosynthesis protein [Fervidobacterium thailandense]